MECPDYAPRLSAAIMMPSLYLIARTLVPVTIGCLWTEILSQGCARGAFDELGVLDSLSEGVLNIVGPLVNRKGSVGIEGIVPLQILW